MTGVHPAVAAARRVVRDALADLAPGDRVLVACSGGADSLALLSATVFGARSGGWYVVGATVDHGLQPDSAEVAARVVAQMAAMGADETASARVSVEAAGLGPEAAARQARYDVLDRLAEHLGATVVLLGHTRDDQAETVLLGLTRGSGGRSVAGMRRAFGRYRRPFLDLARADTAAACAAEALTVWDDPHNDDPTYLRVRVRHHVLPLLEAELGPGVTVSLARTADLLRADMELLDDLADRAMSTARAAAEVADGLSVDVLAAEPGPVRTRVLRAAALAAGALAHDLAHDHVVALDRLVTAWHGQGGVDLPGHLRGVRRGRVVAFERSGGRPA